MWPNCWGSVKIMSLTSLSDSTRNWSYSLSAARNMMEVTFSKQWIHFLLSDLWPPTSTILMGTKRGFKWSRGPTEAGAEKMSLCFNLQSNSGLKCSILPDHQPLHCQKKNHVIESRKLFAWIKKSRVQTRSVLRLRFPATRQTQTQQGD